MGITTILRQRKDFGLRPCLINSPFPLHILNPVLMIENRWLKNLKLCLLRLGLNLSLKSDYVLIRYGICNAPIHLEFKHAILVHFVPCTAILQSLNLLIVASQSC